MITDDLRDYRFYAEDLVHPSEEGVQYIWEKFQETYLDDNGKSLLKQGGELNLRCRHRFLMPDAPSSIEFRHKTEILVSEFIKQYPEMINPVK